MSIKFDATRFLADHFPTDDSPGSLLRAHALYKGACARRDAVRKWRTRNSIPGDMLAALLWALTVENFGEAPNLGKYLSAVDDPK